MQCGASLRCGLIAAAEAAVTTRSRHFAFGNVAIDDLVFADGTTLWEVPGGGAVYAALGMAVWTGSAAVAAPAGPDFPRERFAAIDFAHSRTLAHSMRNWGLYETDGSRHFLARRDSLPWEAFSSNAAELDAGPYPLCHIAPLPLVHLTELIAALWARGARAISLDLHDRELAAAGFAGIAPLVERVTIFLPSRQDAAVLFPGCNPGAALRLLRERLPNVPVIGMKCDADGVILHAAGARDVARIPATGVKVVDATGAGDAFCGGFLAGFAEHGDIVEAGLRGAVSASFALAGIGPALLADPDLREKTARLAALRERVGRAQL